MRLFEKLWRMLVENRRVRKSIEARAPAGFGGR